jgi:hypothetical protein
MEVIGPRNISLLVEPEDFQVGIVETTQPDKTNNTSNAMEEICIPGEDSGDQAGMVQACNVIVKDMEP